MKFRWETEFKETEIGKIPRDWEVKKATEYADFIRGIEPGSKSYKNFGKYRFIRVGNLSGEREDEVFIDIEVDNEKIANKNDILISFDGTVGIVRKGLEGIFSSGIRKIKIKQEKMQELNYEFLYWFFKSTLRHQIFGFSDEKTTLAHASDSIPYLKIFLPPLPEQSRIATVLSWFDDLIENKERQNEILEKTAMAIFKSWFIDFEPFRDGEFVYNEELGKEIPKGWEVKRLGEVVKTQYGVTISGENLGEIKLLRITDINKTFVIDWDNVPYCNLDEKMFYKYNLSDKDVVISRIADIGKVAIIEDPPKSVFASYLIRLKIKSDSNITPYYLYYWLKSEIYQEYILGAGEGSTRENTNAEVIKDGPILIPDISILQKFEKLACDLRSKIILNQKQIMTLKKVRETFLPLLVFGKLRVEEI